MKKTLTKLGVKPESIKRAAIAMYEAEINAVAVEGGEGPVVLRHHERRVVGEHDAARAESDAGGVLRDVAEQQRRRARHERVGVVVLGDPEPRVADPVRQDGQLSAIA